MLELRILSFDSSVGVVCKSGGCVNSSSCDANKVKLERRDETERVLLLPPPHQGVM